MLAEASLLTVDTLLRRIAAAPPVTLQRATRVGDRLDDLELLERLGEGGMGVVFRAREHDLGRDVAVKVARPELLGDEGAEALAREAKATARLSHPNIVAVYRIGWVDAAPYVVFELLRGETLAARLDRGPVPLRLAARWCRDLIGALAYAHAAGVVHRDLKPGNLIVSADDRIKIVDFGLAQLDDDELATFSRAGTPGYMAPEQVAGASGDAASDVWSLGATLRELLPDEAPAPLRAAIADMLRDTPADRPTAAELVRRLDDHSVPITHVPSSGASVADIVE